MNTEQTKAYLDGQALAQALWWFIENVAADAANRTELFFHLRERMRKEGRDTRDEQINQLTADNQVLRELVQEATTVHERGAWIYKAQKVLRD
jgi:hypothetical protein